VDGAIRAEALVLQFFDQYYPSLSMMLAAKASTSASVTSRSGLARASTSAT